MAARALPLPRIPWLGANITPRGSLRFTGMTLHAALRGQKGEGAWAEPSIRTAWQLPLPILSEVCQNLAIQCLHKNSQRSCQWFIFILVNLTHFGLHVMMNHFSNNNPVPPPSSWRRPASYFLKTNSAKPYVQQYSRNAIHSTNPLQLSAETALGWCWAHSWDMLKSEFVCFRMHKIASKMHKKSLAAGALRCGNIMVCIGNSVVINSNVLHDKVNILWTSTMGEAGLRLMWTHADRGRGVKFR